MILGGGDGTLLYPLTKARAKPAIPIGGAYRLIDIPSESSLVWTLEGGVAARPLRLWGWVVGAACLCRDWRSHVFTASGCTDGCIGHAHNRPSINTAHVDPAAPPSPTAVSNAINSGINKIFILTQVLGCWIAAGAPAGLGRCWGCFTSRIALLSVSLLINRQLHPRPEPQ